MNGVVFNKPFVEKPISAEDHNIYMYYPTSAGRNNIYITPFTSQSFKGCCYGVNIHFCAIFAGGGSQRLFRKIGSRSSVYSSESGVRKTGSYIYEDFMPTDGTDVKVCNIELDYS